MFVPLFVLPPPPSVFLPDVITSTFRNRWEASRNLSWSRPNIRITAEISLSLPATAHSSVFKVKRYFQQSVQHLQLFSYGTFGATSNSADSEDAIKWTIYANPQICICPLLESSDGRDSDNLPAWVGWKEVDTWTRELRITFWAKKGLREAMAPLVYNFPFFVVFWSLASHSHSVQELSLKVPSCDSCFIVIFLISSVYYTWVSEILNLNSDNKFLWVIRILIG